MLIKDLNQKLCSECSKNIRIYYLIGTVHWVGFYFDFEIDLYELNAANDEYLRRFKQHSKAVQTHKQLYRLVDAYKIC